MLYLHIILLKRRVDLGGQWWNKAPLEGSLHLKLCKLKQEFKSTTDLCQEHMAGNERTHITEVFTDTG